MRTYEAIDVIGKKIIEDGLSEAIILKGSIGRGDDDEYSDVDMYIIADESNINKVIEKRREYLSAYKDIVYLSEGNFGLPQSIAIFEDGLHFDLYVSDKKQFINEDPIKVYYDPNGLFKDYSYERRDFSEEVLVECFNDALYYFVEADSAYKRKNYAWTCSIMGAAVAQTAILLRYRYDKKYAFLGLKKLNEIIPLEEYMLIENAQCLMRKKEFNKANEYLIKALEIFINSSSEEVKGKLNLKMFNWLKRNLNKTLFK